MPVDSRSQVIREVRTRLPPGGGWGPEGGSLFTAEHTVGLVDVKQVV